MAGFDFNKAENSPLYNTEWNQLLDLLPSSYTIFKKGALYYAVPGKDGGTILSNATMLTLIDAAIAALTSGGRITTHDIIISPYDLTMSEDVVIIENYKGKQRKISKSDDGYIYVLSEEHDILTNRPAIPKWHERGEVNPIILGAGKLILVHRKDIVQGGEISWAGRFTYGTYEWKGYVSEVVTDWDIYLGFCEEFPAGWRNAIFIWYDGSQAKWLFETIKAGTKETTEITGINFLAERKFKIEWTSTYVKFYIDDVLKATHSTQVPTTRMIGFIETLPDTVEHATNDVFSYTRDWQKIV